MKKVSRLAMAALLGSIGGACARGGGVPDSVEALPQPPASSRASGSQALDSFPTTLDLLEAYRQQDLGKVEALMAVWKEREEKAQRSARETIPQVRDFVRLYLDSRGFFSYYTGEAGPTTWNSVAGLHGRYQLTVQIEVDLDPTRTRVIGHEPPRFFLVECRKVSKLPDGRTVVHHGDTQRHFGEEDWRRIVEKGGDLSALGITIVKDAPVEGFDAAWRGE